QDQISLNRWTINAGLRFDYLKSSYPDFDVDPRRYVPVAQHFEGADVLNWKDLSPRLALAYDVFGNGKRARETAGGALGLEGAPHAIDSVGGADACLGQPDQPCLERRQPRLRRERRP